MLAALLLIAAAGLYAQDAVCIDSVDAGIRGNIPLGSYAEYTTAGFGCETALNFKTDIIPGLNAGANLSWQWILPKTGRINMLQDLSASITVGYRFYLDDEMHLSLNPSAAYGWLCHLAEGDMNSDGTATFEAFSDQFAAFKFQLAFDLDDSLALYISPGYLFFFEGDRSMEKQGQEIILELGSRFYI